MQLLFSSLLTEETNPKTKDMKNIAKQQALEDMRADESINLAYLYFSKEILEFTREENKEKKTDFRCFYKKEEFKIYYKQ